MATTRKPKEVSLWDGSAECVSEDYDDMGGGAFCVQVDAPSLYTAKEIRKLIRFLEKAEKWMKNKEEYKPRGRKCQSTTKTNTATLKKN